MTKRSIQKIDFTTGEELVKKYVLTGTPVIIRNATEDSPLSYWTFDYIKSELAGKSVQVHTSNSGMYGRNQKEGDVLENDSVMAFDDLIDGILQNGFQGGSHYLKGAYLESLSTKLSDDVPISRFIKNEYILGKFLWVGPAKTISPLHYDWGNNFLFQAYGRKKVILYEHDQSESLYPYRVGIDLHPDFSEIDIKNPDYSRYPNFEKADPIVADLTAGDMLLIPSCCWHYIESLTPSISVSAFWQVIDEQISMPSITRLLPLLYPEIFRILSPLGYKFGSFLDLVNDLLQKKEYRYAGLYSVAMVEKVVRGIYSQNLSPVTTELINIEECKQFNKQLADILKKPHYNSQLVSYWLEMGSRLLRDEISDEVEIECQCNLIKDFVSEDSNQMKLDSRIM